MSEVRMDGNVIKYTDYTKIQQAIQDIYQTKWFQGNAQYPTTFSVLSKDAGTKTSNSYTPQSLLDAKVETDSDTFKSLSDYIAKEKEALNGNCQFNMTAQQLALFSKVSGLNFPKTPLTKKGGVLKATTKEQEGSILSFEFLWNRSCDVITFFDQWREKWYTQTAHQRTLIHQVGTPAEGYFGLSGLTVATDGAVSHDCHLSIFGLIPIELDIEPKDFGPATNPNNIPKIIYKCTYSYACLVYPKDVSNAEGGLKRVFLA